MLRSMLIVLVTLVWSTPVPAQNWSQWRGDRLDGVSSELFLPTEWSPTKNVAWKLPMPGPAGSTPVIWGDHIFLTSVADDKLLLMCISDKGKELWQREIGAGNKDVRGDEGNSASPSPCTDGKYVWAFMGTGDLACYDFAGNEIYKFNLQDRYGKFDIQFGMTSTPVLDGNRLYFQLIHTGGAQVICLDKATGKEIWKRSRASDAHDECLHSYASPTLYRDDKQSFLITHGADYVVAHRLEDGQELWRCGGLNPPGTYNNTLRFVASPVAVPGLIVVPSAKNGPVLGILPTARGDITTSNVGKAWTMKKNTPDVPSPLVYDGLVYLCRENGNLICLEAKTGKQLYEKRTHADRHRASPVYADGKIFLTARDGTISVVKPGPEFELLASNSMNENMSSSPAIAERTIYLRTFDNLYAIRRK